MRRMRRSWVTPCVGVWIEICFMDVLALYYYVTPCVGVWIEIRTIFAVRPYQASHSLRGSVD